MAALKDSLLRQLRQVGFEICYTFGVNFGNSDIVSVFNKKACEHPHAGTDFKYRESVPWVKSSRDATGYVKVNKKMLTQSFFRLYILHNSTLLQRHKPHTNPQIYNFSLEYHQFVNKLCVGDYN